jgi:hypothetical protein
MEEPQKIKKGGEKVGEINTVKDLSYLYYVKGEDGKLAVYRVRKKYWKGKPETEDNKNETKD